MIIFLNQIPEGDRLHRKVELDPAFLELSQWNACALSPLSCQLEIGVSGSGLFAFGVLSLNVELQCVACLERFAQRLHLPHFAMQVELEGREFVDLTPFLREDLLLLMPPYPHCDVQGERVCPVTFPSRISLPADLKEEKSPSSVWGALDQLQPEEDEAGE